MGGKEVDFFSRPFLPSSVSYRLFFFFCKMVLCKLQMLLFLLQKQTREDIEYCLGCGPFQVVLSKKPNINNTQTKNPTLNPTLTQQNHNPHPPSTFSFSIVFVSLSCIHKTAAKDGKREAAWAHCLLRQLVPSLAGPL